MMFSVPLEINLGVITVWSGAIANIPPGWFLCDGTQGTPDLTDRFVPSAGPTFAVGDTGGSVDHTHDFNTGSHNHFISSGAAIQVPPSETSNGLTDSKNIIGTTDVASIIPPFYALAYIQFNGV